MIVRLMGGLGNQMFQYAFGRALCLKRQEKLILDTWSYCNDKSRSYELGQYNILKNKGRLFQKAFYNVLWNIKIHFCLSPVLEKIFGMECEHMGFGGHNINNSSKYLVGYWQCTEYFANIRDILINEFKYMGELSKLQKQMITDMQSENSIAVHIRRGDYLNVQDIYVNLERNYYDAALQYITERAANAKIYIFSDDMEWCKREFADWGNVVFVDEEISSNMHTDFELMKNCRHYIIANSTYSWWAAWLSENDDKLIVAPADWFCDSMLNERVGKALLEGMVRL